MKGPSSLPRTIPELGPALALLLTMPVFGVAQSPLRIAAYNVRHGSGMDDEVDLERIAEVLRGLDADVITLQEVDNRTERTGVVDQVAVLAGFLGYRGFHGAHRPYQGGEYGNAVLTRLPVHAVRTHRIPLWPETSTDVAVGPSSIGFSGTGASSTKAGIPTRIPPTCRIVKSTSS